jgi:BioD-like phosphotransacetylase family protein
MGARKIQRPFKPLYVAATTEHGGKSAISLGLCLALRQRGLNVGYFKPVGVLACHVDSILADADALQAREVLNLSDELSDLCPIVLSAQIKEDVVSGKRKINPMTPIKRSFMRVAKGRDIVIIEGLGQLIRGGFLGASGVQVTRVLDAKALLVAKYGGTVMLDRILAGKLWVKDRLLGVVFNFVPRGRSRQAEDEYRPFLAARGVDVFGVIKSNPKLSAITVQAIKERLNAEVLCAEQKMEQLVESMLIGAMNQEHALRYFQRVAHKVVVTGGDRSDIILAALETPTAVVVLTGSFHPTASVIARAQELGVPLLLTGVDTLTAINELKELFGSTRVKEKSKINLITKLVEEHVDLERLIMNLKGSKD